MVSFVVVVPTSRAPNPGLAQKNPLVVLAGFCCGASQPATVLALAPARVAVSPAQVSLVLWAWARVWGVFWAGCLDLLLSAMP